jgi:hypothetical protein
MARKVVAFWCSAWMLLLAASAFAQENGPTLVTRCVAGSGAIAGIVRDRRPRRRQHPRARHGAVARHGPHRQHGPVHVESACR